MREKHRIFDLVMFVVDTCEDKESNDVAVLLGDPVPAVLQVEPQLERSLHRIETSDKQWQLEAMSKTYGSDLNTSLALLPIGNALLNPVLHRIGPLVGLDLAHLDALALRAAQILLEILDLRASSM
jgi:hypothetical protein